MEFPKRKMKEFWRKRAKPEHARYLLQSKRETKWKAYNAYVR